MHNAQYEYLLSNFPKEVYELPDYTWEEHFGFPTPSMPPRSVIYDYLFRGAMEKFSVPVDSWFHPNTVVLSVDHSHDNNTFSVVTKTKSDEPETRTFDYVVVASGIFGVPNIPTYPGFDSFRGKIMHAKDHRSLREFSNSKVLLVGRSVSAEDIYTNIMRNHLNVDSETPSLETLAVSGRGIDKDSKLFSDGGSHSYWFVSEENLGRMVDFHDEVDFKFLPEIKRIVPNSTTVEFVDGTTRDIDLILLATGYKSQPESFLKSTSIRRGATDKELIEVLEKWKIDDEKLREFEDTEVICLQSKNGIGGGIDDNYLGTVSTSVPGLFFTNCLCSLGLMNADARAHYIHDVIMGDIVLPAVDEMKEAVVNSLDGVLERHVSLNNDFNEEIGLPYSRFRGCAQSDEQWVEGLKAFSRYDAEAVFNFYKLPLHFANVTSWPMPVDSVKKQMILHRMAYDAYILSGDRIDYGPRYNSSYVGNAFRNSQKEGFQYSFKDGFSYFSLITGKPSPRTAHEFMYNDPSSYTIEGFLSNIDRDSVDSDIVIKLDIKGLDIWAWKENVTSGERDLAWKADSDNFEFEVHDPSIPSPFFQGYFSNYIPLIENEYDWDEKLGIQQFLPVAVQKK